MYLRCKLRNAIHYVCLILALLIATEKLHLRPFTVLTEIMVAMLEKNYIHFVGSDFSYEQSDIVNSFSQHTINPRLYNPQIEIKCRTGVIQNSVSNRSC